MSDDGSDGLPAVRPTQKIASTSEYADFRDAIIERAGAARQRASRAVNTELVLLYWSVGRAILAEQERHAWGDDVVGLLARDLRARGDLARGSSRRNLFYMRRFAALWPKKEKVPPLAARIGWTLHRVLLDASRARQHFAVTRDPYVLDFIDIADDAHERELERALVREIPRFLRELGVGFAVRAAPSANEPAVPLP